MIIETPVRATSVLHAAHTSAATGLASRERPVAGTGTLLKYESHMSLMESEVYELVQLLRPHSMRWCLLRQ